MTTFGNASTSSNLNGSDGGPASRQARHLPQVTERSPGEAAAASARACLQLYHKAAAGCDGIFMLTTIDPKTGKVRPRQFAIGDVEGMAAEAVALGGHSNVYFSTVVLRRDLSRGARGTANDIVAVLGLPIDDDVDTGRPAILPRGIKPSIQISTSTGPHPNQHLHFVFTRPLPLGEAKTLAELLHRKCGGDHGTKDVAHVWRLPQTWNHPNTAKIARGRPAEPQSVELTGGSLEPIDPDVLGRALEAMPDLKSQARKPYGGRGPHTGGGSTDRDEIIGRLPGWVVDRVETKRELGQRSEHCFRTMMALFEYGLADDEVGLVAEGAPFAAKYKSRGDLGAEIARVRAKWEESRGERTGPADRDDQHTNGAKVATKDRSSKGRTQAQVLIENCLRDGVDLYQSADGTTYADINVNCHRETWPTKSTGFRRWLRRVYYEETGGAPNSEAMSTAMGVIEARAQFDGAQRPVHLRVVDHGQKIYLDLCDAAWRAIEIDADGWRIVDMPPVRFRRTPGMLAIPDPVRGGKIDELRNYIYVDDDTFVLIVSWLLAILRGRGPYPILGFTGEQGTGKSFTAEMLRLLLDPHTAPLRSLPRDTRDLYVAAINGHVLVFDNLSGISAEISDSLCRLSTGGGFSTRALYKDSDEVLFDGQRPIAMTSITDVANRSDLADRLIIVRLQTISDELRRPESELRSAFEAVRPLVLGALLDVVAHGLMQLPHTRPNRLPRMADYALWVAACETAIWSAGMHMAAYDANRGDAVDTVLEADPVAMALRQHMEGRSEHTTTCAELLTALSGLVSDHVCCGRQWPGSARGLSGQLTRLAPALRRVGIVITSNREGHTGRRRLHILKKDIR